MRRLFVSLPMNGLSEEEIRKTMAECKKDAEKFLGEEFELLNSYITVDPNTNVKHVGLYYLGISLEIMARADLIYFAKGWENARGCRVEREAAVRYGLPMIMNRCVGGNYVKYYDERKDLED